MVIYRVFQKKRPPPSTTEVSSWLTLITSLFFGQLLWKFTGTFIISLPWFLESFILIWYQVYASGHTVGTPHRWRVWWKRSSWVEGRDGCQLSTRVCARGVLLLFTSLYFFTAEYSPPHSPWAPLHYSHNSGWRHDPFTHSFTRPFHCPRSSGLP